MDSEPSLRDLLAQLTEKLTERPSEQMTKRLSNRHHSPVGATLMESTVPTNRPSRHNPHDGVGPAPENTFTLVLTSAAEHCEGEGRVTHLGMAGRGSVD